MTESTATTPHKFQVGDKVRFTSTKYPIFTGQEGTVTRLEGYSEGTKVWYTVTKDAPLAEYGGYLGRTIDAYSEKLTLIEPAKAEEDVVNDPSHYGGANSPYEVIKVAEAWGFDKDSYLFNVLKYIARAHLKGTAYRDLAKARYYLDRKITRLEEAK